MLAFMRAAALTVLICSSAIAQAQQSAVEQVLSRAVTEQQNGDLQAAIGDYQKVLALDAKLADVRVNLGAALAQAGRFDEAIAQYRLVLKAEPDNTDVRRNLGLAYYKKGDLGGAIPQFEECRKRQPNDVGLAVLLGDSEVRSGKGAEALAMLTPLEAANAANPDFAYILGTALIASGKRRDGAMQLQRLADATQSVDAYFLAGSTFLDLNEAELARKDLDTALRMNPALPHIYTLAGMARDSAGDHEAAEKAFREALRLDPGDFNANLYLGAILTKRRDLEEAKRYLDRALALNQASTMARYEVAMWKSTSGQYDSAVVDLEKIVKEDPDWLEPHVELAAVYYRLHRPAEGAKQREIVARITEQQQSRGPGR